MLDKIASLFFFFVFDLNDIFGPVIVEVLKIFTKWTQIGWYWFLMVHFDL